MDRKANEEVYWIKYLRRSNVIETTYAEIMVIFVMLSLLFFIVEAPDPVIVEPELSPSDDLPHPRAFGAEADDSAGEVTTLQLDPESRRNLIERLAVQKEALEQGESDLVRLRRVDSICGERADVEVETRKITAFITFSPGSDRIPNEAVGCVEAICNYVFDKLESSPQSRVEFTGFASKETWRNNAQGEWAFYRCHSANNATWCDDLVSFKRARALALSCRKHAAGENEYERMMQSAIVSGRGNWPAIIDVGDVQIRNLRRVEVFIRN